MAAAAKKLTSIKRRVQAALDPRIAHADDRAAGAVDGGPREPRAGPEALLLGAGGEVKGVADAGVDVEAHEGGGPLERVRVEGAVERRVAGGEPAKEGVGERRERAVVQGGADDVEALGGVGRGVAAGFHDLVEGLNIACVVMCHEKTHVDFAAERPGTVELVFGEHPDGTVWKQKH